MHIPTLLTALLLPASLLAAPSLHVTRQGAPPKPQPCVRMSPAPNANVTKARFGAFADAFIYNRNISRAFEFIAQDYINHNPLVENGFDSAWNLLSPTWNQMEMTPLRSLYSAASNQGWVNYDTAEWGEIVDRFRWEAGCIAEHWDQSEQFPSNFTRPA